MDQVAEQMGFRLASAAVDSVVQIRKQKKRKKSNTLGALRLGGMCVRGVSNGSKDPIYNISLTTSDTQREKERAPSDQVVSEQPPVGDGGRGHQPRTKNLSIPIVQSQHKAFCSALMAWCVELVHTTDDGQCAALLLLAGDWDGLGHRRRLAPWYHQTLAFWFCHFCFCCENFRYFFLL